MNINKFSISNRDKQVKELVSKKNVNTLYQLLKPHMRSMAVDEFSSLLRSVGSLEKTFFKSKPLTNNISRKCLVNDTDEEDNVPTYPTFLEYDMVKGIWIDKITKIGYKENNYSSDVITYQ
jgi:hypothetical protein